MKKGIIFLFGLLLCFFTIFSFLFVDPNLHYLKNFYTGFFSDHRGIVTLIYILFVLIFFCFYIYFIRAVVNHKVKGKDIISIISIVVITLFFSYPAVFSYDIFNYMTTAKVSFFYWENPYIIMPVEFIGEPFLSFTHAANKLALYAPFWIILTGIPFLLSFGNFIFMLYSFKLLVSFFYIATAILLWKLTKNYLPVVIFTLNPLVVIEVMIGGHNDIVMMFFALLSFYLLRQKKILFGLVSITLSVLIKYATIILFPIFLYTVWIIIQGKKPVWDKVFISSAGLMFFIFLLSPLREEIYPWYAIWFLVFIALVPSKKNILYTGITFSFGLLFRYVPFMALGTYFGPTPIIKQVVSITPLLFYGLYYAIKKKI